MPGSSEVKVKTASPGSEEGVVTTVVCWRPVILRVTGTEAGQLSRHSRGGITERAVEEGIHVHVYIHTYGDIIIISLCVLGDLHILYNVEYPGQLIHVC